MLGIELVRDRATKEPAKDECARVHEIARDLGLLLGKGGLVGIGAVDIGIAGNLAAARHSAFVTFLVVHPEALHAALASIYPLLDGNIRLHGTL